ncbi:hypothetical protein ACHAW5_009204 [Stephanodiscus triporus]|uniref:Integrase zinc-binding domain-containing protein n=1 Tax=Stephanodiscus triporus TaxID=2934178 RepID=A0ABD3PLD1_9STRA
MMKDVAETSSPATEEASLDLMDLVESAAQLPDGRVRDTALLEALRMCRREMEDAESESHAARLRLDKAQDKFDSIAILLSGGASPTTLTFPMTNGLNKDNGRASRKTRKREFASYHNLAYKRAKASSSPLSDDMGSDRADISSLVPSTTQIPTNPIHKPETYTSAGTGNYIMTEESVAAHRESFYQKILGVSASEVEYYAPGPSQANLRSRAQLTEGIHIVRHWDTGADGLDVVSFRSMHKSWYTKMKPATSNLGRRTGIHVRSLEPSQEGGGEELVLCRYSKDGTRSTLYLDVTQLYDALFEIHCLECNHAGGINAVKSRVAELYANVPEGHIREFLHACPVCIERRSISGGH